MPEREVVVCSADDGQQARNSCPELHIFFIGITWFFLHVYALAGYECLLASLPRLNPLCQHFLIRVLARCWPWSTGVGRGLGSKPGMSGHGQQHIPVAKSCGLVQNHKCCAQVSLYKLVMPEREVVVCSADEGQQARNSCPELHIFGFFYMLPPKTSLLFWALFSIHIHTHYSASIIYQGIYANWCYHGLDFLFCKIHKLLSVNKIMFAAITLQKSEGIPCSWSQMLNSSTDIEERSSMILNRSDSCKNHTSEHALSAAVLVLKL